MARSWREVDPSVPSGFSLLLRRTAPQRKLGPGSAANGQSPCARTAVRAPAYPLLMAPVSSLTGTAALALGACPLGTSRPHVVAEVEVPGGLDAGEDARHGLFLRYGLLRLDGLYLTVARHDRHAADPQPRPRPRMGRVLRVSRGPAVAACDDVARVLSDRPGQDPPTRACREELACGGDRHHLAPRPDHPPQPTGPRPCPRPSG